MKKLALILLPAFALAACGETADDAGTSDVATVNDDTNDTVAGDGGAPEMANVQAAFDEECPTLRARVQSALCTADGLGASFTCSYSFAQDPEGSEREVVLYRGEDGVDWDLRAEPEFCGTLDRAAMVAEEGVGDEPSVDTQPE